MTSPPPDLPPALAEDRPPQAVRIARLVTRIGIAFIGDLAGDAVADCRCRGDRHARGSIAAATGRGQRRKHEGKGEQSAGDRVHVDRWARPSWAVTLPMALSLRKCTGWRPGPQLPIDYAMVLRELIACVVIRARAGNRGRQARHRGVAGASVLPQERSMTFSPPRCPHP